MKAKVYVTLKKGVHDPQGEAVRHALSGLGFREVSGVRVGKLIELNLKGEDKTAAEARVKEMCERLLSNAVIESYTFEVS